MRMHPAIERLHALHRRLRFAYVIRHGSIGLALGLLAGSVAPSSPAWLGAAGACAGIAFGMWRAPGISAATRLLDARLALQDRLVTALDVAGHGDPMSELVLDDAWARVAAAAPASAVPMRAAPAVARVGVAVLVVGLMAAPDTPWRGERAGMTAPGGGDASREQAAGGQAAAAAGSTAGRADQSAVAEPRTASSGELASTDSTGDRVSSPGGEGHLPSTAGAGAGGEADAGSTARSATREAGEASGAAAGATHDTGGRGMSTASVARGTDDRRAELDAPPSSASALPTSDSGPPLVQRTEAALARAQVPPGLRRYVMTYFLAITQ